MIIKFIMGISVNTYKNKIFINGVHIKILTICWNSLVPISTKSKDLIGYAQSAGNQRILYFNNILVGTSETTR